MRRAGRSAPGAGSIRAFALLGVVLAPALPAVAQSAVSAEVPAGASAVGATAGATSAGGSGPGSPVPGAAVNRTPRPDASGPVRQFQAAGGVVGYPDGTYGGPRSMTRYELAMAVSRLLPWIAARLATVDRTSVRTSDSASAIGATSPFPGPSAASVDLAALNQALSSYVAPRQLSRVLQDYAPTGKPYSREQADRILAQHADLLNMMAFLGQLRDQLAAYGVDSNVLNRERRAAESGLARANRLQISGESSVSFKASAEFSGDSHRQSSAGVDQDGALLDDGPSPGSGAAGARGKGKRGVLSDPSVLYDTQIGLRYNPSADAVVIAQFITGSYWGAWREQQAYSAAFGSAAAGLLSNRAPANLSVEPYLAYLSVPVGSVHRTGRAQPGRSQTGRATLGRVPTRLTPFTWWAVDPDTALANGREDSGVISLTGAAAAANLPGVSLSVFGGYDPADGTAPWTLASPLDPTLDGRIGFGHPIRPGGAQVPGVGVLYGNATRSHLLLNPLTLGAGAPSGLYYDVPALSSVAGVHASTHGVGISYVVGTGDDWRRPDSPGGPAFQIPVAGSAVTAPVFNRTGQVMSVDWNTAHSSSANASSAARRPSFQGELAGSKTNNWGAWGVQSSGPFATASGAANVRSTAGNALNYRISLPMGPLTWYLGARSISPGYNAPGYWGALGSWVNPWNIVSDSPLYLKSGTGPNRWDVPLIPSEIGVGLPLKNVPLFGTVALSLQAGVEHLHTNVDDSYLTPVAPSSGLAEVTDPEHFKITHASAGLSFGGDPRSGFRFGVQAEDVLRDYPASGGLGEDATFLWNAIRNLLNVSGDSGVHQPHLLDTLSLGPDGPIQSDESYYRLSIARALGADGNTVARLTLSRVVYNDHSPANPASPGGGSYSGALGTMQLSFKF